MRICCDTSVLVAGVLERHPFHARALALLRRVRQGEDSAAISTHALAETYAILTGRVQPRVSPAKAMDALGSLYRMGFRPLVLTPAGYFEAIKRLVAAGISGGAIYDALHLEVARQGAAERIYTFNLSDFRRLAPDLADRIAEP